MNFDDIEKIAIRNIQSISNLKKQAKEDSSEAKSKKIEYDKRIAEYKKIQDSILLGGGWMLLFAEFSDSIKKSQMILEIGKKVYDHDQLADLVHVANERYQLIREAKLEGIELTDESKKLLKEDKLSFLVHTKKEKMLKDAFKMSSKKAFSTLEILFKKNRTSKKLKEKTNHQEMEISQ